MTHMQNDGMGEIPLEPIPSILIESLRDIGYSFNSALADIVDNSISAGASTIEIMIPPAENVTISVIDNGRGLSGESLLQAMRLGSTDPRTDREKTDLGRFGLGMKTASFSQCRRLTVVSRTKEGSCGYVWDLDHVVARNKWCVLKAPQISERAWGEEIGPHGTLVLWEKVDRLNTDKGGGKPDVNRLIEEASEHLSLVFHRFLAGEPGTKKVTMRVNGQRLKAIDPFNMKHTATQASSEEILPGGIKIRAYTLPDKTKYKTLREYEAFGLRGGYLKNQGIYLYRAKRLILHGTWLGLQKKSGITKLCRVKIDIDNSQDEAWRVDVKKVSAQLPEDVRQRVKGLIRQMIAPSKKVYETKGAKQVSKEVRPIWSKVIKGENSTYSIDREHPNIASFREELPPDALKTFDGIIGIIEAAFPLDSLYYDLSSSPDHIVFSAMDEEDLALNARRFFGEMKTEGVSEESILSIMRYSEPYASNWDFVKRALNVEV